jgi:Cu(I)/Ag(I) efflux system membrane fusion protein
MKYTKTFLNKYLSNILLLAGGIFLGWLIFHPTHRNEAKKDTQTVVSRTTIWTCAMHPQIRMPQPGKCPICGMDLIPLNQSGTTSIDPDAVHLKPEAAQLANIGTSVVSKKAPVKEVRLYGKVQADERLLQNQVAHIPGRIESLTVNFTGESVASGQILGQIYSPELITAHQELLEASKTKADQPAIYEAAREKLRQWKLTDKQISDMENSGNPQSTINIVSNTNGIVISRRVNKGDYVSQGTVLYDIADLSKVWVMFDAYESDIQFLHNGEEVSFAIQALPGKNYTGKIIFIDPVIDPVTRVARVRVEANNSSGKFKPGMFATGVVSSLIDADKGYVVIPRSSVLWTGKRSVVYVKQAGSSEPIFKMREIELGPMLGDSYMVMNGLSEGEEIVTSGAFSVDAAAQLAGKPSMMNSSAVSMDGMKGMEALQKETFGVSGKCELCKDRIEAAAKSVKGVSSAIWDNSTGKIQIEFNNKVTSLDAVQKAIADAGHDNIKYRAPDEVYNKLPECCLYREKKE